MNAKTRRILAAIEDGQHRLDSQAYAADTARLRAALPAAVRVRRPALSAVPSHPLTLSPSLQRIIASGRSPATDPETMLAYYGESEWENAAAWRSPQAGATSDLTVIVR